jgi:hypothetical protein
MSETEDRVYALIDVAGQQQGSLQAALDGLAAERLALQRERQALARGVEAMRQGASAAVRLAVLVGLAGAGDTIAAQAEAATKPVLAQLAGVVATAGQAETAMRRVVLWASWRLLGWVIAAIAALSVLWWLAGAAVLWWDDSAIRNAQAEKAHLEAEVAALQANYDDWVQKGMLGKLEHCGPKDRPCIRVDESAGAFGDDTHHYWVIKGY